MSALTTLMNVINNDNLLKYDFKYCLVDDNKCPFKIDDTFVKPNEKNDFVDISILASVKSETLLKYKGLGISIQASNVCAIDIDHCCKNKFDLNSITEQALDIINLFKDFAYIEFSFSGTGIRIFFKAFEVKNYVDKYYIKNSKIEVEYYYPEGSYRYVTITGKSIYNNQIKILNSIEQEKLQFFLDKYMKRQYSYKKIYDNHLDDRTIEELLKVVKYKYLTDNSFQNLWFTNAPGSGKDESERDYHLVAYLYDFITKDKDKIKQIFEQSPFYKTKDWKHVNKWTKQDYRYYNYLYDRINRK